MAHEIAALEKRRYLELAKQQAMHGAETDPHILIELNDLRAKHGPIELLDMPQTGTIPERRRKLDLDIDWLTVNYAAILRRTTAVEKSARHGRWLDYIQIALLILILVIIGFYAGKIL